MIYYNEKGEIIDESEVDLAHGHLEPRDTFYHEYIPEISHIASTTLPNGEIFTYKVIDRPAVAAWTEVISETYYYTGPTDMEKLEGQVLFTAIMTDTLLEEDV